MRSILIIDDEYAIRVGLSSLLHRQFPNIQVHAIPNNDTAQFLQDHSDLGLIISDLPETGFATALPQFESLQAQAPNVPILLHCGCKHSDFNLLACISAGARGFLSKNASLSEYLNAISTVMEGRAYLTNDVKIQMIEGIKAYKMDVTQQQLTI